MLSSDTRTCHSRVLAAFDWLSCYLLLRMRLIRRQLYSSMNDYTRYLIVRVQRSVRPPSLLCRLVRLYIQGFIISSLISIGCVDLAEVWLPLSMTLVRQNKLPLTPLQVWRAMNPFDRSAQPLFLPILAARLSSRFSAVQFFSLDTPARQLRRLLL